MTKHISCDCKCKCNSTTYSNQKCNNKTCRCECKSHHKYEKYYSWNPSTCICENSKYLKSIGDTSVIVYDEFIFVLDIVSTNMTNTIATSVSINFYNEDVRYKIDCYGLHAVLLTIMLILIVTIICYH